MVNSYMVLYSILSLLKERQTELGEISGGPAPTCGPLLLSFYKKGRQARRDMGGVTNSYS